MHVRNMARCALCAALLTICAWISVPMGDTAFTLQTLGVALSLWLLGGKWGTICLLVYVLLGGVGLPVFSGFQGGLHTLLGATGGYIMGFLLWGLSYWLLTAWFPGSRKVSLIAMVLGLLLCYGFGTVWFSCVYLQGEAGLGFVLLKCVVPYLLPDGVKLTAAWFLAKRLKPFVY